MRASTERARDTIFGESTVGPSGRKWIRLHPGRGAPLIRRRFDGTAASPKGKVRSGRISQGMQGSKEVISALNKMLLNELTAIDQYFLHARLLRHWGLHGLGEIIFKESIGEMRHADWLIERILFLDGSPNLQHLGKLQIGADALTALQNDLNLEMIARDDTAAAITLFEQEKDYASRDVATKILVDSEEHVDFLERQLDLVKQLGLSNYLQSAMGPVSNQLETGAAEG
jgi:bacterioferritin